MLVSRAALGAKAGELPRAATVPDRLRHGDGVAIKQISIDALRFFLRSNSAELLLLKNGTGPDLCVALEIGG